MSKAKTGWASCVSPWGQSVFLDLVSYGAQTDPQHLSRMGPVPMCQRERILQVNPLDHRNGGSSGRHWRRSGLRLSGWLKFFVEASRVDHSARVKGEHPAHKVGELAYV